MKSIAVGDVLGVGVVAGAGALAYRGLRKRSKTIRVLGTAAAVGVSYVTTAVASFLLMDKPWFAQEVVRWNSSALALQDPPQKNRAWIKLGGVGATPPGYDPWNQSQLPLAVVAQMPPDIVAQIPREHARKSRTASRRSLRGVTPPPTSSYRYAPREVHDLPFNLLRSEVPLESDVTIQAIEQYEAGRPEVIARLPQKMGFNRWRQGGGVFGGNIAALAQAVTQRDPMLNELVGVQNDRLPHLSLREIAKGMNYLPNTGSPYENPISRGIPQRRRFSDEQLRAIARGAEHVPDQYSPFDNAQDGDTEWIEQQLRQVRRSVRE